MSKRKPTNTETLEGALAVREGRRHINLNQGEREALLRQRTIEQAVALFLDLENDRSWAQIAAELDMSVSSLKRLSQSPDFMTIYEDALATIGHDPRLMAVTSSLGDLLPAARRRLEKLITSDDTPAGVQLKSIEKLFEWTGANKQQEIDDPNALKNFLGQHGVQVQGDLNLMQINIPAEYQQAFERFLGGDTDTGASEARTEDSADQIVDAVVEDAGVSSEPSEQEVPPDQERAS